MPHARYTAVEAPEPACVTVDSLQGRHGVLMCNMEGNQWLSKLQQLLQQLNLPLRHGGWPVHVMLPELESKHMRPDRLDPPPAIF